MNGKKFDWHKIHQRLEIIELALEQDNFISDEGIKKILKSRAQVLANGLKGSENNGHDVIEVIEFLLADEKYAVETSFVREVYSLKDLTPIPCVPSFVLGIVNIRGEILSVIDIKRFFELPAKGLTNLNKAIILTSDHMSFGILADEIMGTRDIFKTDIQPPLSTLTGIREAYLHGITADHIAVLDGEKILRDNNLRIHETVD